MNKRIVVLLLLFYTLVDYVYSTNNSHVVYTTHHCRLLDKCSGDSIKLTYRKYMELSSGKGAQGAACFGDYLIQGYDGNRQMTIYNLSKKKKLATIGIDTASVMKRCHVNTMNFGRRKYHKDDFFPLLYVSSGYSDQKVSFVYVYRVVRSMKDNKESFSANLVQTISLRGFSSWTEGVIDSVNDAIWIKYARKRNYGYAMFPLPSIKKKYENIVYHDNQRNFRCKRLIYGKGQGHLFYNNKIIFVAGASINEDFALLSVDVTSEKFESWIDLKEIGFVNDNDAGVKYIEPESVFMYNGSLMISYRKGVYEITIEKQML